MKKHMYDAKCEELAEYFLTGEKAVKSRDVTELAQTIQDAIEDWLEQNREERA